MDCESDDSQLVNPTSTACIWHAGAIRHWKTYNIYRI